MITYEIVPSAETENEIIVHPRLANHYQLANTMEIQFGLRTVKAYLKRKKINEQTIILSKNLIDQLLLPLNSRYEIKHEQGMLIIGPFIGFYLGNNEISFNKNMKKLKKYTEHYEGIKGAFIAFSENRVDKEGKTILARVYHPKLKTWVEAVTGYPCSIIRDVAMNRELRDHFVRTIGKKIMNELIVNKWTMYRWLQKDKELKDHLPETNVYTGPNIVFSKLKKFKNVYIKPIRGSLGRGIIKASKQNQMYVFQYKKNGKILNIKCSKEEAITFLKKKVQFRKYIVQQGLPINYQGEMIDFRTMTLKDGNGEWGVFGFVGKSSPVRNITSNYSSGGNVHLGLDLLEKIGFSKQKALAIKEKMEQLSIKVGKQLDKTGYHFGNLGIDICLDKDGNIWLIEVNHFSPMHSLIKIAGDIQTYKTIVKTKMSYAKKLSGF